MAYIGRNPAIGTQKVLDSLESQFNGTLTTFDLRYLSNTIYPTIASALIVSLGGVLQEPGEAYTVASDTITFATAPPTGADCWILLYSEFGGVAGATTNLTVGNNLAVQGATDLDGDIDIDAGQITYTASSNIAKFADNAKLIFGEGDDLQIYHTGSISYISDQGIGALRLLASDLRVRNAADNEQLATFTQNGAVTLFYDNSEKFATTTTGATVTGTALATALSTGASGTGINISTNTISGPATLTLDPAAVGDNTGTVIIAGDLQVDGTTTTINSTTLTVDDKNIVLASGAANSAAANDAGITIDGAAATLLYKSTPDAWTFNKSVGIGTDSPQSNLEVYGNGRFKATDGSHGIELYPDVSSGGFQRIISYNRTSSAYEDLSIGVDEFIVTNGASSEALRVDSSGRLLVSTSTARTNIKFNTTSVAPVYQIESTASSAALSVTRNVNSGNAATIYIAKTRGTTDGANTIVQGNDKLGSLSFNGADGANLINAARIDCEVDGTPGANDMPGRLVFSTTADGASSPTERMRIDSTGNVGIGTDDPSTKLHVYGTQNAGGILVEDSSTSTQAPAIKVIGKRSDANTGHSFSGKLLLARNYTGGKIVNNITLGTLGFGGNHTDGTMANILYAASIHGIAEDSFDSATDMPTALTFHTGSTGRSGDTNNVLISSERMRIDSSGNVGIGTTSPDTLLHISGNTPKLRIESSNSLDTSSGTEEIGRLEWEGRKSSNLNVAASIRARQDGTWSTITPWLSPSALEFYTQDASGSEITSPRLLIANNGNVGIGTVNPSEKLDVSGSDNAASDGGVIAAEALFKLTRPGVPSQSYPSAASFAISRYTDEATNGKTQLDIDLINGPTSTPDVRVMSLRSDGNVGIGTNSPSSKLAVNGTGTVASFGNLASGSVDQIDILATANYPTIQCPSSLDTLQIASLGNVQIAIDSNNNSTQHFRIVHGGKDAGGSEIFKIDEGGNFKVSQAVAAWTNSTNHPILMWDFKSGPGDMMYMASGGNTPIADQMALVISDGHGLKVGKSGWNGTDTDISSTNEFFRITTAGNVGIGTVNPQEKLHVEGNMRLNGSVIGGVLTAVVADDSYVDVTPSILGGHFVITPFSTYPNFPQPVGSGMMYYDVGNTRLVATIVDTEVQRSGSTARLISGAASTSTTATDFTDNAITVTTPSGGTLRIFNRVGSNRQFKLVFL